MRDYPRREGESLMASKFDKMEMPRKKMAMASEPTEIKLEIEEGEDEDMPESDPMEVETGKNLDINAAIKELEAMGYKIMPPASEEDEDGVIAPPVPVTGES
jgi:hypothetical protein